MKSRIFSSISFGKIIKKSADKKTKKIVSPSSAKIKTAEKKETAKKGTSKVADKKSSSSETNVAKVVSIKKEKE